MAKKKPIAFSNSNLYLNGFGKDVNGNSVVKLSFPTGNAFSIQTNAQSTSNTHDYAIKYEIDELDQNQLGIVEKEVAYYIYNFGSRNQKKKLKLYGQFEDQIKKLIVKSSDKEIVDEKMKTGGKAVYEKGRKISKPFYHKTEGFFSVEGYHVLNKLIPNTEATFNIHEGRTKDEAKADADWFYEVMKDVKTEAEYERTFEKFHKEYLKKKEMKTGGKTEHYSVLAVVDKEHQAMFNKKILEAGLKWDEYDEIERYDYIHFHFTKSDYEKHKQLIDFYAEDIEKYAKGGRTKAYSSDPRIILSRFDTVCAETGKPIKKGDKCVYYPSSKECFALDSKQAKEYREYQQDLQMGYNYKTGGTVNGVPIENIPNSSWSGTLNEANDIAERLSKKQWNTYFFIIEKGKDYSISKYNEDNAISYWLKGKVSVLRFDAGGGVESNKKFEKNIYLGTTDFENDGEDNEIYVSVELTQTPLALDWETYKSLFNVPVLRMSGEIWETDKQSDENYGRDILSGGQNHSVIKKIFKGDKDIERLVEIWEKYHLNDLQAGSKRQNKIIEEWLEKGNKFSHEEVGKVLREAGVHFDNGYTYGSQWLYQPIPDSVIVELKNIISRLNKRTHKVIPTKQTLKKGGSVYDSMNRTKKRNYAKGGEVKVGDAVEWKQDIGSVMPLIHTGRVKSIDGGYANVEYMNNNMKYVSSDVKLDRLTILDLPKQDMFAKGGGVDDLSDYAKGGQTDWIQDVVNNPNFDKGAFTKKAKNRGMTTKQFMNEVLKNPSKHTLKTRRQAQLMKNMQS
jgi:hypothetical protein